LLYAGVRRQDWLSPELTSHAFPATLYPVVEGHLTGENGRGWQAEAAVTTVVRLLSFASTTALLESKVTAVGWLESNIRV